ncbi:MAG: phosphatidate cytidylyltransferase [Vulcanimicrobiaceae bacterium]
MEAQAQGFSNPITARRVLMGVLVAVVGLASILVPWAFYVLVLVVGLVSFYELDRLCEIKGQPLVYPVAVLGVVGYILLTALQLLHKWEGVLLAVIVVASFGIGMYGEQKGYFARTAYTLLSVLYIGKLLTYFVLVRQVDGVGAWWTLFVVVTIALTDILGMVIGTLIGRHPLTKISPKKTIEGSLGALIFVTVAAALLAVCPQFHLTWVQGAVLGAVTCLAAQAGDLIESGLKRDAGVKDTGSVIVGHGGVLDRFDSYLFGGVAFFAMLHVLGILGMR